MAALVLAIAVLLQQEPPEERSPSPHVPGRAAKKDQEEPLEALVRFLTHPFVDNGRRFDAYPYASDGPYYTRVGFSDKTFAFEQAFTFGYIDHETWMFDAETRFSWSSGCDLRNDFLVFEKVVDGDRIETHLNHLHLDIGGYEGPRTIDWSVGFGFGILDDEDTSEVGPSIRSGFRWYPGYPFSVRLDGTCTLFDGEAWLDLKAEMGLHVGRFAWLVGVRSVLREDGEDRTGPTFGMTMFF